MHWALAQITYSKSCSFETSWHILAEGCNFQVLPSRHIVPGCVTAGLFWPSQRKERQCHCRWMERTAFLFWQMRNPDDFESLKIFNSIYSKCFACFASIFCFLFFILFSDVGEVLKCPNSKEFSLKCQKESAWIFPWAEIFAQWSTNLLPVSFNPGLQGFRTYKWFEKCGPVLSVGLSFPSLQREHHG